MRLMGEALRSLWAERGYAALMMIGLVIGISSVTVIYEMGEGVRERVVGMMSSMGFGADAFFLASGGSRAGFRRGPGGGAGRVITAKDVEDISRLVNVNLVVPQLNIDQDRVSAGARHITSRVRGVHAKYAESRRWDVAQGRFVAPDDDRHKRRVAVLGATTARELFPDGQAVGRAIRIGNTPFIVIGVLASKGASPSGHDRDDVVLVPITTAQRRLSKEDKFSAARVNMADPAQAAATVEDVRQILRANHHLAPEVPDDFTIVTPETLLQRVTQQSQAMVAMLTFIAAVSLFVSGIVIMNIMLVAVSERAHEIGVRRAVGATRGDVLAQVLCESLLVALIGGVCGLGLGMLLSRAIGASLDLPVAFSLPGFLLSFLFSAGVGLVFGLFPARRAAALEPVECLR
ncbi:MAG: ABC transporter permease [Thermodesulfobacteriota bacterium]